MFEYKSTPPAFPQTEDTLVGEGKGMTLRDYFAAQALAGFLANVNVIEHNVNTGWDYRNCNADVVAGVAYAQADAMMRERAQ